MKVSPIFYMGCKRKLINKGLIDLFPEKINTFVDLFAGGGIVSINVNANRYFVNDIDTHLYDFYHMFKTHTNKEIISHILSMLDNFGMLRVGVKQNTNEANIYKPRYLEMRKCANESKNVLDLYTCLFYAFSQQMRFNKKGDFNMPFGNGSFTEQNEKYITDGCNFFQQKNVYISHNNYRLFNVDILKADDFVYLDPPYLNTTATYNENNSWTIQNDKELFDFCDNLTNHKIKWGMSNVFKNKDIINQHLIDWVESNNYYVYYFNEFNYHACGKGNAKTVEVFITNYTQDGNIISI